MAEELNFHLLKFAAPECVIARIDFVAEGFPDLGDSKGEFQPGAIQHVAEVGKDSLGRFGTEVGFILFIAHGPHVGLEHEVKLARLSQFSLAPRRGTWPVPISRQLERIVSCRRLGHHGARYLSPLYLSLPLRRKPLS